MGGYKIIDNKKIDAHITFIRINPTDIKLTLKEVFESLSDLSWLSKFTIDFISSNIIKSNDDSVTSNSGEYIVSELARKSNITLFFITAAPPAIIVFVFFLRNLDP